MKERIDGWMTQVEGWMTRVAVAAPVPVRQLSRPVAWVAVLGLYALAFGWSTWRAVEFARDPVADFPQPYGSGSEAAWATSREVGTSLLGCGLVLALVAWAMGGRRGLPGAVGLRPWRTELSGFGWATGLATVAFMTAAMFSMRPFPAADGPYELVSSLVGGADAGPLEELTLVVAPVVLLRAARIGWVTVLVTLVLLRLAFHVYYGWPVVFLALWAAGMVIVYLRTRAVVGLIVAHSLWDVRAVVLTDVSEVVGWALTILSLAVAYLVISADAQAWLQRRRDAPQ